MKMKKKSNTKGVSPLQKPIKIKRKSSDLEEESTVHKALDNVKKVFEKKKRESTSSVSSPKVVKKRKVRRPKKIFKSTRGIVYIGHIPHGFYEEQMKDYFKQFGRVTRVRVARSRNTGNSRGYGYVEFDHSDVAKIAAETMNNYLMCGRLLKATYIPPEKQHARFFAGTPWSTNVYPKLQTRNRVTKLRNAKTNKKEHAQFVQSTTDKLSNLEKKLKEKGFDLKFKPVDNVTK